MRRRSSDGPDRKPPCPRLRRRLTGALLVCCTTLLVAVPGAAGHGGATGYTATITSVTPVTDGLVLTVLDGDDRLQLRNETGKEVVVLGYEGEPYLRFDDSGVQENLNSPAAYLNDERYGAVELPENADPAREPLWKEVIGTQVHDWHDHRIHWMSPEPPPAVRDDPDRPHRIYEWTMPIQVDGQLVTVAGTLDYAPPAEGSAPPVVAIAAPLAALLALGGFAVWRRRKTGRTVA